MGLQNPRQGALRERREALFAAACGNGEMRAESGSAESGGWRSSSSSSAPVPEPQRWKEARSRFVPIQPEKLGGWGVFACVEFGEGGPQKGGRTRHRPSEPQNPEIRLPFPPTIFSPIQRSFRIPPPGAFVFCLRSEGSRRGRICSVISPVGTAGKVRWRPRGEQ
ncbi:uncharacterized protein LOC131201010 isoform X4 [Ahaetulla prasina]|uniref:uncharacterized protein LOC131201010 isoform X4 n=1 Tax=Ahaetulla prasina TaxID=499056 RepID=UPI002648B345|nr:uncharacterized protein LOC131201010 isoform X4 [Ahaetulla prasina]